MPRRKEVTIESLQLQWQDDGAVASPRLAERPRPMAYELGRVLLALPQQDQAGRATPTPVVDIARIVEASVPQVRAALNDLRTTECIVQQRASLGRQRAYARWAQGFVLAPALVIHGPARRPRLCELALIVDESIECGDFLDVLLRRTGILAVQAVTAQEALRLLERIGFELVIADARTIARQAGQAPFSRTMAASGGPLVQMTRKWDGQQNTQLTGARITLQKPFDAQQFETALNTIGTVRVAVVFSRLARDNESA